MSTVNSLKIFNLPDLGEGLPDAEIVRWLVKEGDTVALDQPMVEMETAKAVVEVPSPFAGKITKLCGQAGDVIEVGAVLVEFDGDSDGDGSSFTLEETIVPEQPEAAIPEIAKPDATQKTSEETPVSMDSNQVFNLPDLGEGLPDAEIVRWLVAEGDVLTLDQPMVEMETAKAVVEVPSPFAAKVAKFYGQAGDVIEVGAPLVSFGEVDPSSVIDATVTKIEQDESVDKKPADAATVVGAVQVGNKLVAESVSAVIKALARKLKVDLIQVSGSGSDGEITQSDVKQAKKDGKLVGSKSATPQPIAPQPTAVATTSANDDSVNKENPLDFKASPAVRAHARRLNVALSQCVANGKKGTITKADVDAAINSVLSSPASSASTFVAVTSKAKSAPKSVVSTTVQASSEPQTVRGVRRAMAMGMSKSHASVVPTTLMEDVDITSWPKQDSLARYVRALVFASKIEPSLNCWFDGEKFERIVHPNVHVGIAIDSPDGLYVPVIHDADSKDAGQIRARVQELRQKIESKGLKQQDQQGATVTLSNFGSITGRYGTPVVSPPQVAILGTGRFRNELKLTETGIENRKMLPLSLTFDHRACTGGEAARFLAAIIEDLQKSD